MELMIGLAVAASFVAMSFAIAAVLKNVQAHKKQRETETFNAIVGAAQLKHGFNYPGSIDGYWPQNEEEAHNYANILDNVILELDMACDTLERGSRVFELVKSHRFSLVRQLKLIEAIKFGGMTSKEAKATPKNKHAELHELVRPYVRTEQTARTSTVMPQPKSSPDTGRNKNGPYGGNARMGSHDNRRNDDDNFAVGFGLGYGQGYVDTTPSRSSGGNSRCDDNSSSRDYDAGHSGGGCDSGGGGGGE